MQKPTEIANPKTPDMRAPVVINDDCYSPGYLEVSRLLSQMQTHVINNRFQPLSDDVITAVKAAHRAMFEEAAR